MMRTVLYNLKGIAKHVRDVEGTWPERAGKVVEMAVRAKESTKGLDLAGIDFRGRDIKGADFDGSDMKGCLFDNNDISATWFPNCDLRGASFKGAKARYANFLGCDLENADMKGNFEHASIVTSNLSHTQREDIKRGQQHVRFR